MVGPDGEEVTCAQRAIRPFGHVGLRDLFDDGLRHTFCFLRRA